MTKHSNFCLVSITGLAVFGFSGSALAEARLNCSDTSNMNQSEMTNCSYQDFGDADAELNKIWPKVKIYAKRGDNELGEGEMTGAGMLVKAQRSWLVYRDAQCELEGFAARGGSLQPMLVAGCKADLTKQRVKAFKVLLEADGQ